MKKHTILLSILLVFAAGNICLAQKDFFQDLPCYKKIVLDFYARYEPGPDQQIAFVKKPGGWYVSSADSANNAVLKPFKIVGSTAYTELDLPKRKLSDEKVRELPEYQQHADRVFEFERCAFYGYSQWSWDIIQLHGKKSNLTERELESLGRAYANYANGFLAYFQYDNNANSNSPYRQAMKAGETLSSIRLDSFLYYEEKAIESYAALARLNTNYGTLVGNIRTKLNNEYVDVYLKLMYIQQYGKARTYLDRCEYHSNMLTTAYNYLSNLPKDAILFTYGDNDTFPLWFLQINKEFRRDVSVVNIGMIGHPDYFKLITDPTLRFNYVEVDTQFRNLKSPYFLSAENLVYNASDSFPLNDFLKATPGDDSIPRYKPGNYYMDCSGKRFTMLSNANYIYTSDLQTYHMIEHNLRTRPLIFTVNSAIPVPLQSEWKRIGTNFEISFRNNLHSLDPVSVSTYLKKDFRPFETDYSYDIYADKTLQISYSNHIYLIAQAIGNAHFLNRENNKTDQTLMKDLVNSAISIWPDHAWHYNEALFYLLGALYESGLNEEAKSLRMFLQQYITEQLPKTVTPDRAWFFDDYWRMNSFSQYINNLLELSEMETYPEEKKALSVLLAKVKTYE